MKHTFVVRVKGGPGSGHWGHAGRPGQRGGGRAGSSVQMASGAERRASKLGSTSSLKLGDYGSASSAEAVGLDVFRHIERDPKLYNMVVALGVDGVAFGSPSVYVPIGGAMADAGLDSGEAGFSSNPFVNIVGSATGMDDAHEIDTKVAGSIDDFLLRIEADIDKAKTEPGWFVKDISNITPERKEWERKYYGAIVGGYENGSSLVEEIIVDLTLAYIQERGGELSMPPEN